MSETTLKTQLTDAMKLAMKAREKKRLGAIRLILAEVKRVEVDERIDPDDARILPIMDKMLKQRRDSIKQYLSADRKDLADQESFEISVIESFLPEKLTSEEIDDLVSKAILQSGATSMKDMGKVMGRVKPQIQGRADAAEVSKKIKSRLSQ